jgi:hypothetical protein
LNNQKDELDVLRIQVIVFEMVEWLKSIMT